MLLYEQTQSPHPFSLNIKPVQLWKGTEGHSDYMTSHGVAIFILLWEEVFFKKLVSWAYQN
jgi:hypothetical protein